jgi:hypothetical protein
MPGLLKSKFFISIDLRDILAFGLYRFCVLFLPVKNLDFWQQFFKFDSTGQSNGSLSSRKILKVIDLLISVNFDTP